VIVLDASALVELLLDTPTGRAIATRIADPVLGLHVPHLASATPMSRCSIGCGRFDTT